MKNIVCIVIVLCTLCAILSLSLFVDKGKQRTTTIVTDLMGRQIVLDSLIFTQRGKDTININISSYPYKIFTYVRQSECISCNIRLNEWKKCIKETDSLFPGKVGYILYYPMKRINDIVYYMEDEEFDYPICIDANDQLQLLTDYPQGMPYQTFLLDEDNKIIAVGNPVINNSVKELYYSIIQTR